MLLFFSKAWNRNKSSQLRHTRMMSWTSFHFNRMPHPDAKCTKNIIHEVVRKKEKDYKFSLSPHLQAHALYRLYLTRMINCSRGNGNWSKETDPRIEYPISVSKTWHFRTKKDHTIRSREVGKQERQTCLTQCKWNWGRKMTFKNAILKRYPAIVSCLVIGSLNFTRSSYAIRSIPWSSNRWARSSYRNSTSRSMFIVGFSELWAWSTGLARRAHFNFNPSGCRFVDKLSLWCLLLMALAKHGRWKLRLRGDTKCW